MRHSKTDSLVGMGKKRGMKEASIHQFQTTKIIQNILLEITSLYQTMDEMAMSSKLWALHGNNGFIYWSAVCVLTVLVIEDDYG